MSEKNFSDRLPQHISNLGKLSLSILEHYVSKVIGDSAIKILREPYEPDKEFLRIVEALSKTEEKLQDKLPQEFLSIKLGDLSQVMQASKNLEKDIDFNGFEVLLQQQVSRFLPNASKGEIEAWVHTYSHTLKLQLIASAESNFTEKFSTQALIELLEETIKGRDDKKQSDQELFRILGAILNEFIVLNNKVNSHLNYKQPSFKNVSFPSSDILRLILVWVRSTPDSLDKIDRIAKKTDAPIPAGGDADTRMKKIFDWCDNREGKITSLIEAIGNEDSPTGIDGYSDQYLQLLGAWEQSKKV